MASLPQQLPLAQMQTTWASQLNPILSNLLVQGQLLQNVPLLVGETAVNHGLGRTPKGWFLSAPKGAAIVYQETYQPNPTLTLILNSNNAITTDLWVF